MTERTETLTTSASPMMTAASPVMRAPSFLMTERTEPVMTPGSPMMTAASPVMRAPSFLMTERTEASSIAYSGVAGPTTDGLLQAAKPLSAVHPSFAMPPQRLAVSILQAHGMSNFMGDHPYCTC